MSLNDTPRANRIHIGFFGRRNAGKSSLINAVTGQDVSIVSDVKGTTTDPVIKSMELLPLGPVVVIDTPGIDDEGYLGDKRVEKARKILDKTDIAVIVIDNSAGRSKEDELIIDAVREKNIPYLIAYSKCDIGGPSRTDGICVSSVTGEGIDKLKESIGTFADKSDKKSLLDGIVSVDDLIILVTPIDSAAPKGRLILPQQQTLREALDAGAITLVLKEDEIEKGLGCLTRKPDLVITDSQVFEKVAASLPADINLTSFSILMARYKGFLGSALQGVKTLDALKDGDRILISEGCTHHRQCEDIGTVKLPRWIKEYTGKDVVFDTSSGGGFPDRLEMYKVIIHCGGCMLREKEIQSRMKAAEEQDIPFTNYGTAIAYMKGILKRSIDIFPEFDGAI